MIYDDVCKSYPFDRRGVVVPHTDRCPGGIGHSAACPATGSRSVSFATHNQPGRPDRGFGTGRSAGPDRSARTENTGTSACRRDNECSTAAPSCISRSSHYQIIYVFSRSEVNGYGQWTYIKTVTVKNSKKI